MPDSVTQILKSGPPGTKLNIAVLGDGFAAADQTAYNNKVQELLLDGVFGHDYFYEDKSAFNIFRVNLISNAVGRQPARLRRERHADRRRRRHDRQHDAQEHGARLHLQRLVGALLARVRRQHGDARPERARHLGAGLRPRRHHPERARLRRVRRRRLPDRHARVELGGHGARVRPRHRRARRRVLPAGHVLAAASRAQSTSPINTNRATLKWRQFVNPATPVPTGVRRRRPALHRLQQARQARRLEQRSETSACSRAAARGRSGIYRPVVNCRMRGNSPPFCPVCYTRMKTQCEPYAEHTFLKVLRRRFQRRRQGRPPRPQRQLDHASTARTARSSTSCSAPSSGCRGRGSSSPATGSTSATSTATARTRSSSSTAPTGSWSTSACSPTTATTASS